MKRTVSICFLVLLGFVAAFPFYSYAAEETEKTVDPYEYTEAFTVQDTLIYIKKGKTKDGQEFTAKSITFTISPTIRRGEDAVYPISAPSSFTIDCVAGSRVEIPFTVGETPIRDDDWGYQSFSFNGKIVIVTKPTQDWEPAAFSFKAYYVGEYSWKSRIGQADKETISGSEIYTEEKPYTVEFFHINFALGLGEPISPDEKQGHAELTLRSEGNKSVMLDIYLSAITLVEQSAVTADVTKNTDADETAGTTGVAVAAAIVLGSLVTAAAGAAAGGGEDEKEGSSYSMVIYKNFGNKIKYNADAVYVYAKMVETTADGREIDRPDLTGQIDIFSGSPNLLEVSACAMTGEYMGAGVIGGPGAGENISADAVISFRFTGAGGTFQNNVKFKVIGKEYVSLEAEKIMVFAASGKSFELPYELVNFVAKPDEITVSPIQGGNAPFDLTLGANEHQTPVIIATDKAPREAPAKRAFDSFPCEIVAKNSKEYARTVFTVAMCHEGLTAAFPHTRGDEPSVELTADGEARSAVAFYFYLWDDGQKTLAAHPQALETLTLTSGHSDDLLVQNAAEVSELTIEYDKPYTQDGVLYSVFAKRPFPSNRPHIAVGMEAAINFGGERYACAFTVKLITADTSPGSASWDEEYQKLKKIIDKIVPLKHRADFYNIINSKKHELDAPGLVVLRRMLVGKACELNEQLAQGYLNNAAWYDTAIKVCEYLEVAGDVAMSALTTAFLGPLAGVGADMIRQYIMSAVKAKAEGLSVEVWFNNEVKGIVPMLSAMGMGMLTDPQTIEYALGRSMKTQVIAWGVYFGYNFYNEMANNKKSLYEAAKSTAFIFGKRIAVKYLAGRLSQSWAAQKIDSLKAKIKSEGGLSKQDMLDIMQDSQFVRSIKNSGDIELQNAFNQSLRQHVYAPHDTALLHWLQKQPQLEGREVRIDDFTTPGKQSAVNTDRDYRVLMKSGNDWVEVPTDVWKNKSYQIFGERTGFDAQSAYKTLNVEKEIWDNMSPEAQREMWANKNYRQLATDQTHAEAAADFSDQNLEGVANITKVKAGKSRLQYAENLGRMYENKVITELMGNQNKTEALAQLQKGYQQLIEVREGYAKQDIRLPRMDDSLTAGIRDLKNIPTDLSAGNQPHFVNNDTILDMAARLRAEIARMGNTE